MTPTIPRMDRANRSADASPPDYRSSALRGAALGVTGGLVATAVMTAYRLPMFRALPPTAEFWAEYIGGGDAEQYPLQGLLLHLLYGGTAGSLFGVAFETTRSGALETRQRDGLVLGLLYGLLLSAVGTRVVVPYLLDEEFHPDERLVFHVGHVVYGLALGTWFGTREGYGDVYE